MSCFSIHAKQKHQKKIENQDKSYSSSSDQQLFFLVSLSSSEISHLFLTKMLFTKNSPHLCVTCLILLLTVSSLCGITFVSGQETAEGYKTSLDDFEDVGIEAVKRIWDPNSK